MGKSAPKAPDPEKTASAATATNIGTAIANSYMGNVNQVTPDGSLTYSQSGTNKWRDPLNGKTYDIPTWTATQSLSAGQQALKDQNDAASLNLSKLAKSQSGRLNDLLSTPVKTGSLPQWGDPSKIGLPKYQGFENVSTSEKDFSADRQRVEDALMSRMNPQIERDRASLEQKLANQGLQPGSAAYDRAVDEANRSASDARYGAIMNAGQEQSRLAGLRQQAIDNNFRATGANNTLQDQSMNAQLTKVNTMNQQRQAQLQEVFANRNQPINEITGLLSGSQVQNPQFMNIQGQQMPTVDYAGIVANNFNQKMQSYQANQANIGGIMGGIGKLLSLSDDRTKKNKTRHGDVRGRMGLWSYNYKDEPAGTPKHLGLMASEVEKQVPDAVERKNGLRYVNYAKALS